MKRSAAQYAVLSPLLEQALRLNDPARAAWLRELPGRYASQRPALARILSIDSQASRRRLAGLERQLRSAMRGVRALMRGNSRT